VQYGSGLLLRLNHAGVEPLQVWISGEIPRHTDYEQIDESYRLRVAESFIHDEIHDDRTLSIDTAKGLVIILGAVMPVQSIRYDMSCV
jgi:metal-dependent hydrolase (beta-lactamase superfamily II)